MLINVFDNKVYDFYDPLGVRSTFILGERKALLFDTCYGLYNIKEQIDAITSLPVTVVNSHGHHDHTGGNYWFEHVYIMPDDMQICKEYLTANRAKIYETAIKRSIVITEISQDDYIHEQAGYLLPLSEGVIELGGVTVHIIHLPGHTKGSVGLYIPEYRLFLPGDNFNPTTWVFFEECESFDTYYGTLEKILQYDFDYLLCPHGHGLLSRSYFKNFVNELPRSITHSSSPFVQTSTKKPVFRCHPTTETEFVFDASKLSNEMKSALFTHTSHAKV